MKHTALLLLGALIVLAGCGGSGAGFESAGGAALAPTAQTRERVARLFMVNRTMQGGDPSATRMAGLDRPAPLGREGSGDGGGGDSGGIFQSEPYYDAFFELWMVTRYGDLKETDWTVRLYVDEALTEVGGEAFRTGTTFDWSYRMDITKGPKAGAYLSSRMIRLPENAGWDYTYDWFIPDEGLYTFLNSYRMPTETAPAQQNSLRTFETTNKDYRVESRRLLLENGDVRLISQDSTGSSATFTFFADQTGEGEITGPDPGLPAKIVWNAEGTGSITWADGSVTTFENFDFFRNLF